MIAVFRFARALGLTLAAFAVAMLLFIRFAPMRVDRWHVEPGQWHKLPHGNDYMLRPYGDVADGADGIASLYDTDAGSLAYHLQQTALAEPGTTLLAGDAMLGAITLVQRSKWLGFPDAITIWAEDVGPDRSTLAIWSRSRYGNNDWGVNRARVERWLADNRMFEVAPATLPAATP